MIIYICDLCGKQADPKDTKPDQSDPLGQQPLYAVDYYDGAVFKEHPDIKEICLGCSSMIGEIKIAARKKGIEDAQELVADMLKARNK
jgi:hypothetical protein